MEFAMSTALYEKQRRSSRAFLRAKIVLAGKNRRGRKFRQICETIVVSAHGCLFCIPQELEMGAMVTVTSPYTQEEQECRVVYLGEETAKGCRIGIEFLTPAPRFWGMEFTVGKPGGAIASPN